MKARNSSVIFLAGLLSLAVAASAADVISVNFMGDQGGGANTQSFAIAPTETAGVVPKKNWNNCPLGVNGAGALTTVLDGTGSSLPGVTVSWSGHATWSNGNNNTPNDKLMYGYLDDGYTGPATSSVTVAGLPFQMYDVLVYSHGDAGVGTRQGTYYVDNYSHANANDVGGKSCQNGTFTGTFIESDGKGGVGNYLAFRGMTAVPCVISAYELVPGTQRCPLNGFQIIPVSPITSVVPGFAPNSGGTTVTINGSGFQNGCTVTFNNVPSSTVTFGTASQITATVPGSGQQGYVDIAVTNPDGSVARGIRKFFYTGTPATLTSASPPSGPTIGGTTLTLGGTNLVDGATVKIGGIPATSVLASNTLLTCKTPANSLGLKDIVVSFPDGTSATLSGYTYTAGPPLGDTLSYSFHHTDQNGGVQPLGVAEIAGKIPRDHWNNSVSNVNISTESNLVDNIGTSSEVTINWQCNEHWTNAAVADNGGNFRMFRGYINMTNPGAMGITFNNVATFRNCDVYLYIGGDQGRYGRINVNGLTKNAARGNSVAYPYAGAGPDGFLQVPDNSGGSIFPAGNYLVFPNTVAKDGIISIFTISPDPDYRLGISGLQLVALPPVISAVTPSSDVPAGGATVFVTGTNFRPDAPAITFDGIPATNVLQVNATTYRCVVPAHVAGTVDVLMTDINGRSGGLPGAFTYQTTPPPGVISVTPPSGPTGSATAVTISGSNFRAGATVQILGQNGINNATPTSVVIVNSSTITCTFPAATPALVAGAVNIQVTNSDTTTGTLPNGYTYTLKPTITGISPNTADFAATTNVTISGTNFASNFANGGKVTFGSVNANNVILNSNTSISCTVPAMVPNQTINPAFCVVTNPDGSSNNANHPADTFTYTGLRPGDNELPLKPQLLYHYFRTGQNVGPVTFQTQTLPPLPAPPATAPFLDYQPHNPIAALNEGNYPQYAEGFINTMTFTNQNPTDPGQVNNYAYEWMGYLNIPTGGVWTLSTASDDGSYFIVGNQRLVDNNFAQGVTERSATIALAAGWHRFRVQFAEGGGGHANDVYWVGPGVVKERIPQGTTDAAGQPTTRGFYGEATPTITNATVGGRPPALSHTIPQAGGNTVTVTGTNFGTIIASVTIQGVSVPLANVTIVNATTLTFAAPPSASAGAAPIVLTTYNGQVATLTGPSGVGYEGPPVNLSAITTLVGPDTGFARGPSSGNIAANLVQITSTNPNFLPGATVTIGGNNVPSVVVDPTHITFLPPKHAAGAVDVTVVNGDGQAAGNTLTGAYTYVVETIASITPNSGIPNGGNTVVIAGTNFGPATTVRINGNSAISINVNSTIQITCTVPPSPNNVLGAVDVVLDDTVGGIATLPGGYTYANRAAEFADGTGKLQGVTAKFYFYPDSTIGVLPTTGGPNVFDARPPYQGKRVNGATLAANTIMNLVPANSINFATKISGYGIITQPGVYTLYTASDDGTIMWLGDPGTQGFVKVVDNNFSQGVTERSGQVALGAGLHKFTILFAQGGGGYGFSASISGPDTGGAKVVIPDAALFTDQGPAITNISPFLGSSGGNTAVTIDGSGFDPAARVFFNGVAAVNVVVVSPTKITCATPGGAAATINCVVQNPNGTVDSIPFIYDTSPRNPDNPTDTVFGTFFRYYNVGSNGIPNTTFSGGVNGGTNNFVPDLIYRDNANLLPFCNGWRGDTSMVTNVTYPVFQNDNFLVMWNGYITVPGSGIYTFSADTDDNEVLSIGGVEVLRFTGNGQGPGAPETGTINLNAGTHAFKYAFAEGGGGFGSINLKISGPGINGLVDIGSNGSGTSYSYRPPTWSGGTGNFSAQANWLDQIVPDKTEPHATLKYPAAAGVNNETLHIRFGDVGTSAYTATNDLVAPYQLFKLDLNANVNANNVIAGNQIKFCGGNITNSPAGGFPSIEQRGSKPFTISAPIDVFTNMTLEGTGTGVVKLTGVISNVSAITKNGTSAFSIDGSANTFNGAISVNGGSLGINGVLSVSTAIVGSGGSLRGTGTLDGTAIVTNGGYIFPGDVGSVTTGQSLGTLTMTSADFTPGGSLKVRLNVGDQASLLTADKLVASTANVSGATSALELRLQVKAGNFNKKDVVVMQLTTANGGTSPFTVHTISYPSPYTGGPGTIQVLYVNNTFTLGGTTGIVGTWNSGDTAPPSMSGNYDRIVVRLNGAVTPVTLGELTAKAEGAGSVVEWKLASEYQNIGFNLYRRIAGAREDAWVKANTALIPGRITDPSSKTYRFYDWTPPGSYEYRLESVSTFGGGEFYPALAGPVTVDKDASLLSIDGLDAALRELNGQALAAHGTQLSVRLEGQERAKSEPFELRPVQGNPGASQARRIEYSTSTEPILAYQHGGKPVLSAQIRSIDAAAPRAAYATGSEQSGVRSSALAAPNVLPRAIPRPRTGSIQRVMKVVYPESGVVLVPRSALPAGFNPEKLTIMREGRAVPALAVTAGGVLLYGPGYSDLYTDKDVFFLASSTSATAAGVPLSAQGLFNGAADSTTGTTFTQQFHDVYYDWLLRPYDYPPYFSSQYLSSGGTATFSMNTAGATSEAASLTVNAWSLTSTEGASLDHALQAFVNGTAVGQAVWSGGGRFVALTFQVPAGILGASNRIDLVTPALPGIDQQIAMVNSLSLSYGRKLAGPGSVEVVNFGRNARTYEVSGMTSSSLWVVDARYPDRAALAPYETQLQPDGSYKARFTAQTGGSGKYLVVPAGAEKAPLSVTRRTLKPITAVQYLATGPSQFATPAQTLLVARGKDGIKGQFVDQEQLFDYYNYGRYGPDGIRNAVRAGRPQYLLLMGRTTYDYHNYSGANIDPLCPSYLVSTTFWSQTTSDASFGDLGRGYPEVKVGRIPANDAGEASNAVRRILGNGGLPVSGWKAHITSDKADPTAGDFAAEGNALMASFPAITWQHNFMGVDAPTLADATASMAAAANGGANLMLYNGHGSAAHLGSDDPYILSIDPVKEWKGNVVFIAATCTFNWVAKNEQGYRSVPIQALTQPQGGMAASIASTTYMNSGPAMEFTKQLLTQSQNMGQGARWGDVLLRAQQWAYFQNRSNVSEANWYMDLSKTECILGDPAMRVYSKGAPAGGGTGATGTTGTGATGTPTAPGTF